MGNHHVSVAATADFAASTDQQLLGLYQRQGDQQAFTVLVERHHSMVFGVARRMLGCPHAAEDVLQATFLVLARDAGRIRKRGSLASWLYAVTFRIAARIIKKRARTKTSTLRDEVMVSDDPLRKLSEQFEHNAAFEELQRLPEKVREAMILRYLQGNSNAEVADVLGLTEAAVEGRLKRGRNQLRLRLARQGVTFAAAVVVLEAAKEQALAATPAELVARTVEMCMVSGAQTAGLGSEVVHLAEEEMVKMVTTKALKGVLVACLALGGIIAGWSLAGRGNAFGQNFDPLEDLIVAEQAGDDGEARETRARLPRAAENQDPSRDVDTEWRRQVGHYSLEQRTPTEMNISRALGEPTTVEFTDTPLQQAFEFLADFHDVQIITDTSALDDLDVDVTSDGVTVSLHDVQLRSALHHILRPYNLTAIIKDEVLMITSEEVAEEEISPRVYKFDQIPSDELVRIITKSVAPDAWDEVGGPGSIMSVRGGGLVISQSYEVHEMINQLLAQLERMP